MNAATYLGFAPEIQAAVDAIRSTWTSEDHEHRNHNCYYVPDTFVTADAISRYLQKRKEANATPPPKPVRPAVLKPFRVTMATKVKRPTPPKPTSPPIRPIGELIREQLARLLGNV